MPDPEEPDHNESDHQDDDRLAPEPEPDYGEPEAESGPAPGPQENNDRVAELEAELADYRDKMLRAVAESENTRKRLLREREDVRKYAVSDFAKDLLDFSDNFRRALESIPDEALQDDLVKNVLTGVEAMEKELLKTLEKHGINKIEPLDQPFDPNFHEAMFEAPGTGKPAGVIVEIIEPGYVLHDRLLRPARVGIAKDDGESGSSSSGPGSQIDTEA